MEFKELTESGNHKSSEKHLGKKSHIFKESWVPSSLWRSQPKLFTGVNECCWSEGNGATADFQGSIANSFRQAASYKCKRNLDYWTLLARSRMMEHLLSPLYQLIDPRYRNQTAEHLESLQSSMHLQEPLNMLTGALRKFPYRSEAFYLFPSCTWKQYIYLLHIHLNCSPFLWISGCIWLTLQNILGCSQSGTRYAE